MMQLILTYAAGLFAGAAAGLAVLWCPFLHTAHTDPEQTLRGEPMPETLRRQFDNFFAYEGHARGEK